MTAPQPGQPLPEQRRSWENDTALLAIETGVAGLITGGLIAQLRDILTTSARAWVVLFGSVAAKPATFDQTQPIAELLHAELDQVADAVPDAVEGPMGDGVRAAYVLGLKQARAKRETLTHYAEPPKLFVPYEQTPKAVVRQIAALPHYPDAPTAEQLIERRERERIVAAVRAELEQAKQLLDANQLTEKGFTQIQVSIARAGKIQQRIDNAVQWHLLYANQQAISDTARKRGLELIWISERDACVVCLALNGDVIEPGGSFDTTATFGDPAKVPACWPDSEMCPHAPRHNRCRCRCELHDAAQSAGFAAALKRESERAIVYGWRTDSESGEVRRRAAEKLLARGARLPESVKHRGEILIKEPGAFGGPVPDVP